MLWFKFSIWIIRKCLPFNHAIFINFDNFELKFRIGWNFDEIRARPLTNLIIF